MDDAMDLDVDVQGQAGPSSSGGLGVQNTINDHRPAADLGAVAPLDAGTFLAEDIDHGDKTGQSTSKVPTSLPFHPMRTRKSAIHANRRTNYLNILYATGIRQNQDRLPYASDYMLVKISSAASVYSLPLMNLSGRISACQKTTRARESR